jgi:hypothetical protein
LRTKYRSFSGGLALALVVTLLPAAAVGAELVPGRPGRYELSSITIDATSGDCRATYGTPAAGNLWMRGVDASVRVRVNPNWVHVTCRFTDMSALIEGNAEVGHTDACTLVTETTTYSDGWGIATSAANISERAEGGNSVAMCRFRVEPTPVVGASALQAGRSSPTAARNLSVSARDPSGSARAAGPNVTKRAEGTKRAKDTRATFRPTTRAAATSKAHVRAKVSAQSSVRIHKAAKAKDKPRRGPKQGKPGRER